MPLTGLQHFTSPNVSVDSTGNKSYVRRLQYERAYDWESELPAIGDFDATYGYFKGYRTVNGPAYLMLELMYDTEGTAVNFSPADGDTEFFASTRGEEKPIEYHPSFRVKWAYGLYYRHSNAAVVKTTTDYPNGGAAGYAAEDDINALANDNFWRWSKDDPGIAWTLIAKKTKPALESYIAPVRTVTRRDYHRTQASAEADLETVGGLLAPAETFGLSTATQRWLVASSDTEFNGKYWVTVTEFWYSDAVHNDVPSAPVTGWDPEVYT